MILSCNVWCSESDKNRELGLPDGDCWMPISINLKSVVAIKEAGPNDFIGDGKATIYLPQEHFIIEITYQEAIRFWESELNRPSGGIF